MHNAYNCGMMFDWCRREAVQVRGDLADLQTGEWSGRVWHVRRLHGGVQDIRPRGSGLHQCRRDATRPHIARSAYFTLRYMLAIELTGRPRSRGETDTRSEDNLCRRWSEMERRKLLCQSIWCNLFFLHNYTSVLRTRASVQGPQKGRPSKDVIG